MYNKLDKPKDSHFNNGDTNIQLNVTIPNKVNNTLGVLFRLVLVVSTILAIPSVCGGLGYVIPKTIISFLLSNEMTRDAALFIGFISLMIGLLAGMGTGAIILHELITNEENVRSYILKGDINV